MTAGFEKCVTQMTVTVCLCVYACVPENELNASPTTVSGRLLCSRVKLPLVSQRFPLGTQPTKLLVVMEVAAATAKP